MQYCTFVLFKMKKWPYVQYPAPWIEAWYKPWWHPAACFLSPLQLSLSINYEKIKQSPSKIKSSILRLLDDKQAYLKDCWSTEIMIDQENTKLMRKATYFKEEYPNCGNKTLIQPGTHSPTFLSKAGPIFQYHILP